jgi:WD40 repeat protein
MSDIFISYSRKDKAFVSRLFEALESAGRNIWLDVKDIPPNAEWMAEISRSIESANDFLFVISPDSLRSEICARELAHAIAHNKRLVPLVCREPAGEKIPPELGKLNWIFFRDDDPFDQAFATLQKALDTDLDHVRVHTRLLVRAREWEAKGRSGSFTLRGEDLREAENWLAQGTEKDPRPAGLQIEYITFSRRAEQTRQRRTLWAVVAALIVTAGLAVAAFRQSQIATSREHARATQQAIAEEERRIALSGQLATQSRLLVDEQPDVALLLAVLSGQINNTFEATSGLHNALEHRPDLMQYLHGSQAGVSTMEFTREGDELVAVGFDGTILRWNVAEGHPLDNPVAGTDQYIYDITLNPQGQAWVTSLDEHEVKIWNASNGKPLGPAILFDQDIDGDEQADLPGIAALSPDGTTLATAVYEDIALWDVQSGRLLGRSDVPLGFPPSALAFSPDGKLLTSVGNEHLVYLWDARTGKNLSIWETSHTRNVSSVAFSLDGRLLASGSEDGTVNLFDLSTGEQIVRQPSYSITTGQEIPPPALGHPAAVRSLAFSPDGERLVSGAEDGDVLIWDTITMTPFTAPMPAYVGSIVSIAFHPSSGEFAVGGESSSITSWHAAETWRLARPQEEPELEMSFVYNGTLSNQAVDVSALPDSPLQETLGVTETNSGYSAVAGCAVPVDPFEPCPEGQVLAFQPDGQMVKLQPVVMTSAPEALSFNSNAMMLAAAACQSTNGYDCPKSQISIWNFRDGGVKELIVPSIRISELWFSPDGRYLVAGGDGKEMLFLDLESGQETRLSLNPLPGHLIALAFSPDSQWMAVSGAYDDPGPYANDLMRGRFLLFEMESGRSVAEIDLPSGYTISDLAFSENGQLLKFSLNGVDGQFMVWELGWKRWQELACRIANRNLTEREWQRYVIGEEYREVCP